MKKVLAIIGACMIGILPISAWAESIVDGVVEGGGSGSGDVTTVGTPVDSQVGVWTGDGTLEGAADLTYDGSNLQLTGDIGSTGTRITKGWFTDLTVTNSITAASFTAVASALPNWSFLDSGVPGADEVVANIYGNYLSGADGSEEGGMYLQVKDGGADTTVLALTGELAAVTGAITATGSVTSTNLAEYDTIYVDAGAMVGCTTDGAESGTNEYGTNDIDWDYFAFDDGATEERVQFKFVMPEDWDRSTVKVKFYWANASGASAADTVEWAIKAGALGNDDAIDAALGTAVTVSDTVIADGDLHVSSATAAVTVGGTPALGDLVTWEVYRNTDGTDDMTEDAWLVGVLVQYKKDNTVSAW